MKHTLSFLAILIMALAIPQSMKAYDFSAVCSTGQTLYYNISGNNVSVTHENDSMPPSLMGNLMIPSAVTFSGVTYSVTSIGDHAFSNCGGLTSVTLPNSITSIGNFAFYNCSGLTSVTIPNSVTSIGDQSFDRCSGLISLTIGSSVTSIGEYAFSNCSGLTSLTIPNSVTSIGDGAFSLCSGLTSVTIPGSVTSIGSWVFDRCIGLISVTIPNSVTSIGQHAFGSCTSLTSLIVPNSVILIDAGAFEECSGLTSLTIPDFVISIGAWAFKDCSGLTSMTIGASVSSIGIGAIYGCSNLTEITCLGTIAPTWEGIAFNGVSNTIPVNIPCGSTTSYQTAWSYFSNFIEPEFPYSLDVQSNNETMGTVFILTQPTCQVPNAVIYATANEGYHFVRWNDNDTNSTRTVTVTSDTTFIAYFAADGTEEINDLDGSNAKVYSRSGRLVVEGADGLTATLYDTAGRILAIKQSSNQTITFDIPATGTYLVKVGDGSARKVVVTR